MKNVLRGFVVLMVRALKFVTGALTRKFVICSGRIAPRHRA
ncbi:MAG TPA: hypothetical protein VHE37_03185 [Nevskiaceae bacterium]|nr:hypothetical protein [Nevskiaceae bacterium]